MKKKVLSVFLVIAALATLGANAFAEQPAKSMSEFPIEIVDEASISARYIGLIYTSTGMNMGSLGKASVSAIANGIKGYYIYIVGYLQQQQSDGTWKTIKTFTSNKAELVSVISTSHYVVKGTYRFSAAYFVYDANDALIETTSTITESQTY